MSEAPFPGIDDRAGAEGAILAVIDAEADRRAEKRCECGINRRLRGLRRWYLSLLRYPWRRRLRATRREGGYRFLTTGDPDAFRDAGRRFLQLPIGEVESVTLAELEAAPA